MLSFFLLDVIIMDKSGLTLSSPFCFDGNQAENRRRWCCNFENYLLAINLVTEPADEHGTYPSTNRLFDVSIFEAVYFHDLAVFG